MSILVPLAAALLVSSAQIPLATQVQLPTGETVELAADFVAYEADKQVLIARGHCELRTGDMLLRADEVTYDEANQVATADGNVMFVGPGGMAAVADSVRVDMRSFEANLQGGLFMQKRGVTLEAMLSAKTPQELRAMGETPVILSGTRIRRTGPQSFVVDDLAFTPCECGPGEPSWRVEASSANVTLGERATLSWPVVYVRSVPVFALPWLYLPLAERRSGLLIPKPSISSLNGFALEQPVFITLGPSYDVTLTPGYFTGGGNEPHYIGYVPGDNKFVSETRHLGVQGPRLMTEFRYVPSERTRGRLTLGLLYDLRPVRDPRYPDGRYFRELAENGERTLAIAGGARGLRGEASWQHTQDLGGGWHDRIDASFVSDGFYPRDLTADILVREFQYLRSTATVHQRREDRYLGLDVSLRQDIRWGYSFFKADRVPANSLPVERGDAATTPPLSQFKGPITMQRLPGVTLALLDRPLVGRLMGGLNVEYSRLAPMPGGHGDEGIDARFDPFSEYFPAWYTPEAGGARPDAFQSDGIFNMKDREARDRVDFFPRLSTSFELGPYARVSPSLAVRQDVWVGEVSGKTWQRGYPLAGLLVDSQVATTWSGRQGTAYRHTLAPSLEVRYVPGGWGHVPSAGAAGLGRVPFVDAGDDPTPLPYDAIDAAVPLRRDGSTRGFLHAVLAVDQTLGFKRGADIREPLRLRLGQGFDLSRHAPVAGRTEETGPVLRDTFARLSASAGVLTAGGQIRFDLETRRILQLSADFNIDNGKGAALYARFDDFLTTDAAAIPLGADPLAIGPDVVRRRLDTLVGSASFEAPGLPPARREQALIAGTRLTLGFGLGVRYEAYVQPLYQDPITQESKPLTQQTIGLSYGPACDCWRIEGVLILRRDQSPEFGGINLSVAGFGSFGAGG
ncbi:LPS assembly protein LptD [Pyxidicoccus fallax]|uniref:LPS assembly protein LptD n=1 Tax=Pyxidicoccus fallax TaxID=394095 RepID=A0A848LL94_9BACT|nr:LPS assembly protein LptD [Pyxidicoccus fallax]NMO18506.1 LPS assembly protein LptD [Pyxidicoccus fallax]NPC84116.1 LPS assembly protein LptD [Pyxidicoccus fallax]